MIKSHNIIKITWEQEKSNPKKILLTSVLGLITNLSPLNFYTIQYFLISKPSEILVSFSCMPF